jgi:signal transduction histidine kinase
MGILMATADVGKNYPVNEAIELIQEVKSSGSDDEKIQLLSDKIDEINKYIATFVSVMVHEIRKPMTSIRGYSDMLNQPTLGELNDMQQQFVDTIRTNVLSMQKLVDDISDITKMRTGRLKPEAKMDMAKNILMAVEKDNQELAEARNVTLEFVVPNGLPLLNLDSSRAKQAVNKLVENGLKYTPEGGKVTVTAEPAKGGLIIHVEDNGVGMKEEELEQLGDLFFRGDDDLVTSSKGYGMGIPIVLECMKLVDGWIKWESKKGKGSKFTVFLPGMS